MGIRILYTDSSNVNSACLGIVLLAPLGEIIRQAIKYYSITNNEAEYEPMIVGLKLESQMGTDQIEI